VIAIDTNVLVRLVVDDDPDQTRRARKLFHRGGVLVTTTVLLESAWVLAGAYGLGRERVASSLRGVLGLEGVATEAPAAIAQALEWFDAGLDFADALHLAGASGASEFATFDLRLLKRSNFIEQPVVIAVPR
jgi:predicted nucleic-acid-binding protein